MSVESFEIKVPDEVLVDLKRRLARTRWPDEIPGAGWDYGFNLDYVKELVEYWPTRFDWRAQERALNALPQYKAEVDGLGIHFVHQRGTGPNPLPLIITHGWPKTAFEMVKLIPLLADPGSHGADPADSFDVVVPNGPGYGFSDRPQRPGMDHWLVADLWLKLMTEVLDYPRFCAQGGDWGAIVSSRLGYIYPDNVMGIHLNLVAGPRPALEPGSRALTPAEESYLGQRERWMDTEGGYSHLQGTKPQSLAYGLNDSPAGLAAWIVEKWRTWSDCGGDVESRFTKDELLTNVTIYWATQTINSSTRLYYESRRSPWTVSEGDRVEVPCGVAVFPGEIFLAPREWAERTLNVQRWTEMPSGGHFAAMEEPELLAQDIRAFFRRFR